MAHPNSFGARATLDVGGNSYRIWRLDALKDHGLDPGRLPYGLKILLENLLRTEDGVAVRADEIRALDKRLQFIGGAAKAPFPAVVVIFRPKPAGAQRQPATLTAMAVPDETGAV